MADISSIDGLQPESQSDVKIVELGVIFSAMLYGVVVTLALNYIPLLIKTSHTIPRLMRNFLLVYVTFMVAVSTVNTVTLIIAFAIGRNIFKLDTGFDAPPGNELSPDTFPNGLAGALCVTFASWGADGFMVRLFFLRKETTRCMQNQFFIFSCFRYGDVRWYVWEGQDISD